MSPPNERGPASQPSPQETATAAPSRITRTDGGTSAVALTTAVMSVSVPPTEAPMGLAVNAMAANREPIHWWLRTLAAQPQVAFLRAMGWWA